MTNLTDNQYYGGLNRRFDKRVRRLCQMGFIRSNTGYETASYCRTKRNGKVIGIAASAVMHSDKRAWLDTLTSIGRRI